MNFTINGLKWQLKEVDEKTIMDKIQQQEENTITAAFGLCNYHNHEILINKDMCDDQKLQTVIHELTHCYLWSVGMKLEEYPEEMVCDMMYSLRAFLNEIINKLGY